MNREPSPRDTMPLARVTAGDPDDGGRHRRPEAEVSPPPESPTRRRSPALFPVAVAFVALALAGAVVYGTNHQVQGNGTADPAELAGQSGVAAPPASPSSTTPTDTSAAAPPASADVHAKATTSNVVTTTPPPHKPSAPASTGGNGQAGGDDSAAIESSIASSIMSSLQSRFGGPPQRH